eukprot:Skav211257  [mRNA]  locus=scaffold3676:143624:145438:+ [translate_table: standard]
MASSSCGPGCALASEAYSKPGVSSSESNPDKRLAEEDSLQASQNHDLSQLARASINHGVAATARCGEQRKGYVPNPKTRAALSVAYTLPIRFLTKKEPMQLSELLSELPLLKSHGCQDQVKNFLLDEHFPWSNLAIVRRHHYHRNIHYGIQSAMEDSDILGVVAVKSCCQLQETQTLKIFYYSWLLSLDPCVIRDIFTHGFVLQVAGPRPLHDKRDVRRNHFTVGGVTDHTQIEAEIKTFIMDDCKKHFKEEDKNLKDVLRRINGVRELVAASSTSNLKLRGRGLDFCRLANYVTKRPEKRSQRPTLSSLLRPSNTSTGAWNPGNLFKCTFSQADCHLVSPECQELDGCIVVLLPWEDSSGNFQLQKYPKLALVARVDTTYHSICLVPKIALHPCDFLKLPKHLPIPAEVLKHLPHAYDFPKMPGQKKTILSQFKYLSINAQRNVLAQELKNMYKYKVLTRPPGTKWDEHCHQALLCMTLVGWTDRCYVCFEHDIDQHKFQVQADDLRLALPLSEQHLDADGGITVADSEQVRRGGGPLKHLCDNPTLPCKPLRTKQLPVDWYCGPTSEDGMRLAARDKTIPSARLKTEAGRAEVKGPTQEMKS